MPCSLAISSMSLGRCYAGHSLTHKLDMAQKHGYEGLEVFYEDLVHLARELCPDVTGPEPSPESQIAAARQIRQLCTVRHLEIVCLQPFMHYEGLIDRAEHRRRLDDLALWVALAHELGTDLISIPSSFLPAAQVSGDMDLIAADLRAAADLAARASPPVRLSYESLAWGTRVNTWEQCWALVKRVDRPNFGICLDSFNIAARIFSDPASPSGRTPGAQEALTRSMARLVSEVDVRKVFYVQIVDGERLDAPLVQGHRFFNPEQPARMSWSRNCRLFYGERERGAYLPIKEIALAIFQGLGFDGWVSMELFNRRMSDQSENVPEELARRGAISWKKLVEDVEVSTYWPHHVC